MPRHIKGLNIVLVDDDPTLSDSLAEYFKPDNTVVIFSNAEDALKAEDELSKAKVFIIDYHLPGMNGVDLFLLLQDKYSSAKFILITGDISYEMADSTRQLGLDALILKPFDYTILEDNISTLTSSAA